MCEAVPVLALVGTGAALVLVYVAFSWLEHRARERLRRDVREAYAQIADGQRRMADWANHRSSEKH